MNTNTYNNPNTAAGTTGTAGTANTMNANRGMNSATTGTTMGSADSSVPTGLQTNNPLKAGLAAVHGAGETLRGTFNSAVDGAFGDKAGEAKNQAVASGGIDEVETGNFSTGTKVREGVLPGDEGRRF